MYQQMTTKQLQQEYEAKYGIQGWVIDELSRAQLIDGLTNPAHIPARDRRNRRNVTITPADWAQLMGE